MAMTLFRQEGINLQDKNKDTVRRRAAGTLRPHPGSHARWCRALGVSRRALQPDTQIDKNKLG